MVLKNEYWQSRSQLKGYLFEIVIGLLLSKNGFTEININREPRERVRENRKRFIELKGRGCWHQIDCPYDYRYLIPFTYPLRLLGEVKFYKNPLEKKYIREYIGTIKDIQENHFVADGTEIKDLYPRKNEVGVYFSANGFQEEAEKLAYAHGIKTVSYANNYLVDRLKRLIEEFENDYLSINCMKDGNWSSFRETFIDLLEGVSVDEKIFDQYCANGYKNILEDIRGNLQGIKSSFLATTATGVLIHFVGQGEFPKELFNYTDDRSCRINYIRGGEKPLFWLTINGDKNEEKFYFTPPESLDSAAIYGGRSVLNEKKVLFRELNINIKLNGIIRNLRLHLDRDWFDLMDNE